MSAQPKQPWEVMDEAMDKIFGAFERAPDLPCPRVEPPKFIELKEAQQRQFIREYLAEFPCEEGLVGESICEHALAENFLATFFAGDTAELGRIADRIIREYLCKQMDREEWRRES